MGKALLFALFPMFITTQVISGEIVIKIVYNNVVLDKKLTPGWGMACVVEGLEKNILFDTGGNGSILVSNMKKLKIDPEKIDLVFLSHIHSDHTGGIESFLDANPDVEIVVPASFPNDFKGELRARGGRIIEVSEPVEVCKNAYSSGQMGTSIKEQSLIIKSEKGLVIITGCAHPGIVKIVERASERFGGGIYLVTGGFHLKGASDIQINGIINDLKKLGVKKVGPSHCTGEMAIERFRDAWGRDFVNAGLGAILHISNNQ